MEQDLDIPRKPKFRDAVNAVVREREAEISRGSSQCSFEFEDGERDAIIRLFDRLGKGGQTPEELAKFSPEIAENIPRLLLDFDRLRLLVESDPQSRDGARSGAQLYREVRRIADRVASRNARSAFLLSLRRGEATRRQLIGYALEYYWIVKSAPGLIGPALATAHTARERDLVQDFLRSELGHDRFLSAALGAVGVTADELELHQPLPETFALGASLGVYARQHPLSFKACLFLFERAQPDFIDAFDERCMELRLPDAFYLPLRKHADINNDYDHEDISRAFLELDGAVDRESCAVVKRHVALMVETLVLQEEQILSFYGDETSALPRIFA